MRIHHLNCGTLLPASGRMVCHCLLVETDQDLVLVDTGFGTGDIRRLNRPRPGLLQPAQYAFAKLVIRARLDAAETALRQLTDLGHAADDVRHVVLTHLDSDHAGGLADFPRAKVHVDRVEQEFALSPRGANPVHRFRYWQHQWEHDPEWVTYGDGGDSWFGFDGVREIEGVPDVALVPLPGHTPGHSGVAIRTDAGGWLLHAADAYFDQREADPETPHTPPALASFQKLFEFDAAARAESRRRLRDLAREHGGEVATLCSHDARQFDRYSGSNT